MKCPYCNNEETKVLETRESDEEITRRRRECLKCEKRFTTYEHVEMSNISVVKKDGSRVLFDRNKITKSMQIACQKRPIEPEKIEEIASKIEGKLRSSMKKEITSKKIGELVLKYLKKLDQVAYIRFASVYRDFQDLEGFKLELDTLES
ncbi:transcriptional regulator NrdR [Candidatus Woesearchaeota archaeon]|nr:transcriptional regulator NrdR [Candidatus Woesearchaeota archaeon]MCF8012853.1 transcriptional regulator NrdR [Candidatus Woesearchaeota archaeon]